MYDSGSEEERERVRRVAEQVFECMSPTDGDAIMVRSDVASELTALLKSAGVKDADIRTNELALGYRKIRVVREEMCIRDRPATGQTEPWPYVAHAGGGGCPHAARSPGAADRRPAWKVSGAWGRPARTDRCATSAVRLSLIHI